MSAGCHDLACRALIRALRVGGNQLSGTMSATLTSMAGLQRLDVRANLLSGSLPSFLSAWQTSMTYLDVSNNLFTGTVPSTISALSVSATVSFANNQLTGSLPAAVNLQFPVTTGSWSGTCIVNATSPPAGCDLFERPALVDLFIATNTTGWLNATGWLVRGAVAREILLIWNVHSLRVRDVAMCSPVCITAVGHVASVHVVRRYLYQLEWTSEVTRTG